MERAGTSRTGYVLAGGRSSRMGRDKALLPYRGATLVEVVAATVQSAAGSVILVGDPATYGHLPHPVIPDLYPGEGPLGGILTALSHSAAPRNLIVACDMPGLTVDFLRQIFAQAEASDPDVLLPVGPSGIPEPLCAVYHARRYKRLEQAFQSGIRKILAALDSVRVVRWNLPEAGLFDNVNTPEDWADYAGH